MAHVSIDSERCKGCLLCVSFCPRGALRLSEELNSQGYHPVEYVADAECTGCSLCHLVCPDIAVTVHRQGDTRSE